MKIYERIRFKYLFHEFQTFYLTQVKIRRESRIYKKSVFITVCRNEIFGVLDFRRPETCV